MNKKTINFQILKVNRFHYTRYTRIRLISKKCTQNTKKDLFNETKSYYFTDCHFSH